MVNWIQIRKLSGIFRLSIGPILQELQLFSDDNDLEIFGSYLIQKDNRYFNEFVATYVLIQNLFSYDKINLFPTLKEPVYLQPGHETCVFKSKLGLLWCLYLF